SPEQPCWFACCTALGNLAKGASMHRWIRVAAVGAALTIGHSAAVAAQTAAATSGDQTNATASKTTGEPEQQGTASDTDTVQPLFFNVTVSAASRFEEETGKTPQAVTVATLDAIERRQARTPNQMLREEPGVWSTQVSTQGSPIIRGQIGNRVLYLWD